MSLDAFGALVASGAKPEFPATRVRLCRLLHPANSACPCPLLRPSFGLKPSFPCGEDAHRGPHCLTSVHAHARPRVAGRRCQAGRQGLGPARLGRGVAPGSSSLHPDTLPHSLLSMARRSGSCSVCPSASGSLHPGVTHVVAVAEFPSFHGRWCRAVSTPVLSTRRAWADAGPLPHPTPRGPRGAGASLGFISRVAPRGGAAGPRARWRGPGLSSVAAAPSRVRPRVECALSPRPRRHPSRVCDRPSNVPMLSPRV